MTLATHQVKGSCSTSPSVPSSWSRVGKLKQSVPTFHAVGRKERFVPSTCRSCTSVGAPLVLESKSELFQVSAFRGNCPYDACGVRANGSKSLKNTGKVSYLKNKSEESSLVSSSAQNVVPTPYTAADETTSKSQAIQDLFKNWLMLMLTPSETQLPEEVPEAPSSMETSKIPNSLQKQERGEILKAAWCYFLGLDATIKITLLLFTPLFLAVNLVYGSKVSKELTPLWILGPLIVALYIKMFQAICGIYAFSFKQTVKVVNNLPVYRLVLHDLIVHGKLKEAMRSCILEPVADIKDMDYKEVTRSKMKDLQGWLVDRYIDFVESVWPHYCRTIRFLKRANLI